MLSAPLVSLVLGLLPVHVRLNSVVDLGHVDSQVGLDIQLQGVVIEHADLAGKFLAEVHVHTALLNSQVLIKSIISRKVKVSPLSTCVFLYLS